MVNLIQSLRHIRNSRHRSIMEWRDFQFHLQNEINRTNRSGSPFTLTVFSVNGKDSDPQESDCLRNHLIQTLCERTRQSDVKGFYGPDQKKVAVMLPDTAYEKSLHLIQSIENLFYARLESTAFADQKPEIACDVYSYPANHSQIEDLGAASDPTGKFVSLQELNSHISSRKSKQDEDLYTKKIAG
ncbi:MAG: hypothetical protein JXR73_22775 [Candidatus Omnitrophica bacterium]|nr:hypothetical protein [Candidatus Omnitrophota bacterium]